MLILVAILGFASPIAFAPVHAETISCRVDGRNAATWEKKGLSTSSERFDYEYQESELREFVPSVRRLADRAAQVHVVFNNNLRDQGIRGARLFRSLLGGETREAFFQ